RGEVFERHQGPLRPADDEISARVDWVFLSVFDQLAAVLVERELPLILHVFLVEEAALRFHHDREVPDVDALRFPLDPVFDDGEIEVDRRGVVQVPQARFHRVQGMRRPVRLLHDREAQRDGRLRLQVDAASAVPLTRVTRMMRPSSIGPSIFSRTWITGSLLRILGSWSRVIFNAFRTRSASSSATSRCSGTNWCSNTLNRKGGPPWATDRFPPGMSSAREPCGPAGTFGDPAQSAGPVRTPDHPVSFRPPLRGSG